MSCSFESVVWIDLEDTLEFRWNNHSINVYRILHDFFRYKFFFFFFSPVLLDHQNRWNISRTLAQNVDLIVDQNIDQKYHYLIHQMCYEKKMPFCKFILFVDEGENEFEWFLVWWEGVNEFDKFCKRWEGENELVWSLYGKNEKLWNGLIFVWWEWEIMRCFENERMRYEFVTQLQHNFI